MNTYVVVQLDQALVELCRGLAIAGTWSGLGSPLLDYGAVRGGEVKRMVDDELRWRQEHPGDDWIEAQI